MDIRNSIFFLAFISLIVCSFAGRCGVNKKKITPKVSPLMQKSDIRLLQEKPWEEIRIFIDDTYLLRQGAEVDREKIELAKKVTEKAVNVYKNFLKVQRITQGIKLNSECGEIPIDWMNKDISSKGLDADIVIFPMFDMIAEETTEAYAAPCHIDQGNNRPISGVMAFNPLNFHLEMKNAEEYYTLLVVHEINHILCFNESLFPLFVDPKKNYRKLNESEVVRDITVNGIKKKAIVSPKALENARKHFNCNNIEGIELESQGGEGTAGSHWDARMMLGDFMIGETYPENVFSEITLGLFEDSGWYKVNMYTAGLFRYGKNKGCDFILKKCVNNGETNFPGTFCLKGFTQMCFANRMSKGSCDLGVFSNDLQKEYQYFSDPKKGGYFFADFCPVASWSQDKLNQMYYSSSCNVGKVHHKDLGETIGSDSSCFMSSLIPKNVNNYSKLQGKNRAICYSTICNSNTQTYSVKILNTNINCPKEGGIVTSKEMDGSFYCPDYNLICTKTAPCRDAVDCALKKVEYKETNYDYIPNSKGLNVTLNSPMIKDSIDSNPQQPMTFDDSVPLFHNTSTRILLNYLLIFLIFLLF